jgi:glutathione S-transferase
MKLTLYHMPGACSRVTMIALEALELDFEAVAVDLMKGHHNHDAYRAINPYGKIPALLVDGELLTENAAILLWLDEMSGGGILFPKAETAFDRARNRRDVIWCAASVHPVVSTIRMPMRFTKDGQDGVHERGKHRLDPVAELVNARLDGQTWWYGDAWSIIDVYLYWLFDTARSAGYDLSRYPAILSHHARVCEQPSFARARTREQAAVTDQAISLPPGGAL